MSAGMRKGAQQDRLPPPPPSREGPPPPPARDDLPPPPPVPRRDAAEGLSVRSSAPSNGSPRLSPRKESDGVNGGGHSPLAKATTTGAALKSSGKIVPPPPATVGRTSVGSAPRPPPPAREDLRVSLAGASLPPPPPGRVAAVKSDSAVPKRSISPQPPPRDVSPLPPRRDVSPQTSPRGAKPAPPPRNEEPVYDEPAPQEPPPRPAPKVSARPALPSSLRGPPKPPPREEDDTPASPPGRMLTQSAPDNNNGNGKSSFANAVVAVMKKPPAFSSNTAPPPGARRGTAGASDRPVMFMKPPPALTSPPPLKSPMVAPPSIRKDSQSEEFTAPPPRPSVAGGGMQRPNPVTPFSAPPPLRPPPPGLMSGGSYGSPNSTTRGALPPAAPAYEESAEEAPYVDLSAYSGKFPPERAARIVQKVYRRWKTLATTKRLAKRAWTMRRFFNAEKLYVATLSAIVGQIIRRIPNRANAPPLFENLEPIANLHGQNLPQIQAAVQALKDGPSGVLPTLLNYARSVNLYIAYADSYRNALSAFIQCRSQSNFVKFVEFCEKELQGESLLPCLQQPLVRFQEYVQYIKLLQTWTSRSNPEYNEITNAIPVLEGAYRQLVEGTKVLQDLDRTRMHILEVIGSQLKMKDIATQPGRAHVRSIDVIVQDVKGKQNKMHAHLFNDVLLLTKRKEDKVRQSTTLDLKSFIQDEADKGSLRNWFRLVTPHESVIFVAESQPEKMRALWAFRDAFEQLRVLRKADNLTDPIIRRPPRANKGSTARRRKKAAAAQRSGAENNVGSNGSTFTSALPPAVRNVLAKAGVTERDLADPKTAEFIMKWLQATMGQQTNAASKYTLKPIAQAGGAPGASSMPMSSPMSMAPSNGFSSPPSPGMRPPPGPTAPKPAPPSPAVRAPAAPPPPPKAPKAPPPPMMGKAAPKRPPAPAAYEEAAEEEAYDESGGYDNGFEQQEEQPAEEYAEETPQEEAAPAAASGLLAALKGAQLKKVDPPPEAQFKQISAAEEDGLAAALSKALQARRPALAEKNDDDEEEEEIDDHEWD